MQNFLRRDQALWLSRTPDVSMAAQDSQHYPKYGIMRLWIQMRITVIFYTVWNWFLRFAEVHSQYKQAQQK
jgi:hypothetical protein